MNATSADGAANSAGLERELDGTGSRPNWWLLYYALAALDLVTVLACITLNHRIMQIYVDSVAASQAWETREEQYVRLEQAALAIAAPGNDVFASRDVPAESARFAAALAAFDAQFARAREELAGNAANPEAALVLEALDEIGPQTRAMAAEAPAIFEHFRAGDIDRAGARMAAMDRQCAGVHEAFVGLSARLRSIRQEHFDQEISAAEGLKKLAHFIVALVVPMVIGALWYGAKIYRAARAAEAVRARYVEALSRARAEADAANHAKSRFLAVVTHEIRTSLSGLFMTLDLLRQPGGDPLHAGDVDMARRSAQAMQHLLDRLLDVAKIESGKIEFESVVFDLRSLLNEIVGPYACRAALKDVSFTAGVAPEVPCTVTGDPLRFAQIVSNLVDNAVKFTRTGSVELAVSLRTAATGGMVPLRVMVRDTGIGLTPEQQARIFDDFVQAEQSTARMFGGTGLGLGIVRGLATLMKGELHVSSTRGVGSVFSVDLDLQAQA